VSNLTALSIGLVGGRASLVDNGPADQLMYKDNQGNRMTLYVRENQRKQTNSAFRDHEQN